MKKIIFPVIFAFVAWYVFFGNETGNEDPSPVQKQSSVAVKSAPKYSADDAMKELEWWATTIASYPERAQKADFADAVKIADQLYEVKESIGEIAAKFPYNDGIQYAARKILDAVPGVQKVIFPKLRKAWVDGERKVMSEYGVRVSCGGNRCEKANFTGVRYYSDELAKGDYSAVKSQAIRLRFKKVVFNNGRGRGGFFEIEDQSDTSVE